MQKSAAPIASSAFPARSMRAVPGRAGATRSLTAPGNAGLRAFVRAPAEGRSHRGLVVRAVASPDQSTKKAVKDAELNGASGDECDGVYPKLEQPVDGEGFFPVRNPGTFPEPDVERPGWLAAISVDFSEDADLSEDAFDPLRDGPLRYLGYSNELGEAFAAWLPPFGVPASYGLAIAYVLVDTYDKGIKQYRRASRELDNSPSLDAAVDKPRLVKLLAAERTLDTVIWQLIASVAAPGYTIHTIVGLVTAGLLAAEGLDAVQAALHSVADGVGLPYDTVLTLTNKSLPTFAGLGAIPFIVHPIDNAVHALMNATLRPAMRKYICENGQGALAGLNICEDGCPFPGEEEGKH